MSTLTPKKTSTLQMDTSTPLRRYFSRKSSSKIRTNDLPVDKAYIGHYSRWGVLYCCIFLTVPIAYIYIGLVLLREICMAFPGSLYAGIQHYIPQLAWVVSKMEKSSLVVEVWCIIEGIFYITMKLRLQWLNMKDPLEASLSAAPMMELDERQLLWKRMMDVEQDDIIHFLSGWFFDSPIESMSRYDVCDFLCWSMFEGRNQEHLTGQELEQLESFLDQVEELVSYQLYGEATDDTEEGEFEREDTDSLKKELFSSEKIKRRPKKVFRFQEYIYDDPPNFFSTLYDHYKQTYEQARHMLENAHPVQDLRNFLVEAEETTMSTASQVYENASTTATHMAANAYNTIIGTGTNMDKQLSAIGHATQQQLSEISHATQQQLAEAWKSVKAMQKRLEAAELLSGQLKRIKQQLKGYRALLNRMREMSSAVPSQQMAKLMRRITECYESIDRVESRAIKGLTTGFAARVNNLLGRKEPKRYAKYSSDPLLGVGTFPLGFHLIALAGIEIPLRIMMHNRGFLRSQVGPVAYYYHPGKSSPNEDVEKVPIVFIHGIGIGLMFYPALIDYLLSKGRPILLPEIPYVSGFKFYQSASSVLPPAVVCSTLTEMLARHGHLKGTFAGHSYGTSWLSYMTKYSPNTVAALCFIDPICFCLHYPRLTKQFVYHRPDPGTISYMVHTDLIVKHTIQRAFPWTHIILFAEQIHVPCSIFLSDGDAMVPAEKVEEYFRKKGAPIKDVSEATREYFFNGDLQVAVFRGDNHGEWTERTDDIPLIGECFEVLCSRVDEAAALEPQSVIQ